MYESSAIDLKHSLLRVGDLINLDGPLLSLFLDSRNSDLYIFDWLESTSKSNRWLVYKVEAKLIDQFINQKISYRTLFDIAIKNSNYYYADIINSEETDYTLYEIPQIPKDYFPTEDVYFEKNDAKDCEQIITITNIIISQNDFENTSKLNYLGVKDFLENKIKKLAFLLNQGIVIMTKPEGLVEAHNTLSGYISNTIETQQNVREDNKLPEKEGMVFHPW
jgi:hypothetical protein